MLDSNCRKANQEQQSILQLNKQVIITLFNAARYLIKQDLDFRREPETEGRSLELQTIRLYAFILFCDRELHTIN